MITNINEWKKHKLNESISTDINYDRVIPRDFFNESKLLKCFGQLSLFIHSEKTPVPMDIFIIRNSNSEPFQIGQTNDGYLTITNVEVTINKNKFLFKSKYNSKSNYPLFVMTDDYSEYQVFDENGQFDEEFIDFCKSL